MQVFVFPFMIGAVIRYWGPRDRYVIDSAKLNVTLANRAIPAARKFQQKFQVMKKILRNIDITIDSRDIYDITVIATPNCTALTK